MVYYSAMKKKIMPYEWRLQIAFWAKKKIDIEQHILYTKLKNSESN